MADIITTHWKGGMQFESDNPSGKTLIMDTNVEGSDKRFGLSPKAMISRNARDAPCRVP